MLCWGVEPLNLAPSKLQNEYHVNSDFLSRFPARKQHGNLKENRVVYVPCHPSCRKSRPTSPGEKRPRNDQFEPKRWGRPVARGIQCSDTKNEMLQKTRAQEKSPSEGSGLAINVSRRPGRVAYPSLRRCGVWLATKPASSNLKGTTSRGETHTATMQPTLSALQARD